MSDVNVNGLAVSSGSITLPMFGAWTADVTLAVATPLSGRVTLSVGNAKLIGTVMRSGALAGSRSARIVGGSAGWRKEIPSKGYSSPAGVKIETVLRDAASACGETIVPPSGSLGPHYARERGPAQRVLRLCIGDTWWVDPAGATQTSPRRSEPIVTPYNVIKRYGSEGAFEIGTEDFASWAPGRTFISEGSQTIASVVVEIQAGKIRLNVLTSEDKSDRLKRDLRDMIRAEIAQLSYAAIWKYTVVSATPGKADLASSDPRMPSITGCALMPSTLGEKTTLSPGSTVYVAFVNSDPSQPIVIGSEGTPLLTHIDAIVTRLGLGAKPVIVAGDLAGIFPCVPTQIKVLA